MAGKKTLYFSYLLRLRRVENSGNALWRFSLEQPGTGKCWSFVSLDDLFAFLSALTGDIEPGPDRNRGGTR